jgi:hypothetical protein
MGKIIDTDWFVQLKEEIESIHTETIFISRIELLKGKWLIGEAIEIKVGDFERAEIYGEKINDLLAQGLGISARELQRCRLFYRSFRMKDWDEVVANLPEGKNVSWNKVLKLLNKPKKEGEKETECKHENLLIKCLDCGIVFSQEEFLNHYKGQV